MAAGQKAEESSAATQERDQESQEQAPEVPKEFQTSVRLVPHVAKEGHIQTTGHAGVSEKALKGHAGISVRALTDQEEISVKVQKEVLAERRDRSEGKERVSPVREEVSAEKEETAVSETQERKVSQEGISTIL